MQKIKYTVEREDGFAFRFYISDKGQFVVEAQNQKIEIDHVTSIELVEILRHNLYEHQAKSSSFLKRIFQ
jgi:hypothetical protein